MVTHFRILPHLDMTAKCGRTVVKETTAYRGKVTCSKCLKSMDRDLPFLLDRIYILKRTLEAKRKMRGAQS